ncbi:MAG: PHP domain-containing protein [Lachnospiraceae bacterium]|nr:PHP domain-containing protein [Lachnospiraceae bacterium]
MIDLHIHTEASDGSDSIPELLSKLKECGIHTFAVTDHDTIDGALEMEHVVWQGARYVKGVEFSCVSPFGKCHILGYGYNASDPQLLAALKEGAELRMAKLGQRLSYVQETYHIQFAQEELDWLYSLKSPGKPHIAELLLKRGIGKDRNDVIRNYIHGTKNEADRILAQTAISGILHAGGIPVWAHPLGGEGDELLSNEQFTVQLRSLIKSGIRGLECHYSRYSKEQVQFLREKAVRHHLLISGGSDYHGSRKNIALGTLNAYGEPVYEEDLTILQEISGNATGIENSCRPGGL